MIDRSSLYAASTGHAVLNVRSIPPLLSVLTTFHTTFFLTVLVPFSLGIGACVTPPIKGACIISPCPLIMTDDGAHACTPFSDTDPHVQMTYVSDPLRRPLDGYGWATDRFCRGLVRAAF